LGSNFEYLELYNTANTAIDLTSFSIQPIAFTFPANTKIQGNSFLIVCYSKEHFEHAYKRHMPVNTTYLCGYPNELPNSGAELQILEPQGNVVLSTTYNDKAPWPVAADGPGATLERTCFTGDCTDNPDCWVASSLAIDGDHHVEFSGSPGRNSVWETCQATAYRTNQLLITEIMYHPLNERSMVESHEYIEIYNPSSEMVSAAGVRVVSEGNVRYVFDENVLVAGQSTIIVAKDVNAFSQVYPSVPSAQIYGPYEGELANGGEKLFLLNDNGMLMDWLEYDDHAPWPIAADALGADDKFLPATSPFLADYDTLQYSGISLQRQSSKLATHDPQNWDGLLAEPGVFVDKSSVAPKVLSSVVYPSDGSPGELVTDSNPTAMIQVQMSTGLEQTLQSVSVNFFVYNPITETQGALSTIALVDSGSGLWKGVLAPQAANAVVMYNISAVTADNQWGSYQCEETNATTSVCACNPGYEGPLCNQTFIDGSPNAWHAIRYILGVLLLLEVVLGVVQMFQHTKIKSSRFLALVFACLSALSTAIYLLVDPYGFGGVISPKNHINNVFGLLPNAFIASSLCIITFHWAGLVEGAHRLKLMDRPKALLGLIIVNVILYVAFIVSMLLSAVAKFSGATPISGVTSILVVCGLSIALIVLGAKIRKILAGIDSNNSKNQVQVNKLTVYIFVLATAGFFYCIQVLLRFTLLRTVGGFYAINIANSLLVLLLVGLQLYIIWIAPQSKSASQDSTQKTNSSSLEMSSNTRGSKISGSISVDVDEKL